MFMAVICHKKDICTQGEGSSPSEPLRKLAKSSEWVVVKERVRGTVQAILTPSPVPRGLPPYRIAATLQLLFFFFIALFAFPSGWGPPPRLVLKAVNAKLRFFLFIFAELA